MQLPKLTFSLLPVENGKFRNTKVSAFNCQ